MFPRGHRTMFSTNVLQTSKGCLFSAMLAEWEMGRETSNRTLRVVE
jgi:hypothetical protein